MQCLILAINEKIEQSKLWTIFGKSSILVHFTSKIFNDYITNFIVQIYLLMVLSHYQHHKLQENS